LTFKDREAMSFLRPACSPVDPAALDRRLQRRLWSAGIFAALFFFWLFFNHANPATRKVVSDLSGLLGSSLAAAWCFWPRAASSPAALGFWKRLKGRQWGADMIGLYFVSYSLGMVYWTYAELILKQDAPFPCPADIFYLSGSVCLMAGILLLPAHKTPASLRGRVLLDGLMIMMAHISFSWYFILGPNLLASATSAFAKVVTLSYPLTDLAMLVCLLIMMARSPAARQRSIRLTLTWGLVITIVADAVYGYMTLKNTYASGNLVDVGWPLGQLLMAAGIASLRASWSAAHNEEAAESAEPQQTPILWRSLLPYAFVPAMAGLLIYTVTHKGDENLQPGVYIGSAVLLGLVLLRQVFALLENHRLYRELEGKNTQMAMYASNLESANGELRRTQQQLLNNNQELAQANGRLKALATCDGMTGLPNHRTFQERLREELAQSQTTGSPLSLLLMDVDKFKHYNDTYGHPAGDEALRIVARLLRENVRPADLPARYGGEEFAVLLPDADYAETLQLAEQIRAAVEAHTFPHRAVTLSIGAVTWGMASNDPEKLIFSADQALYAAKNSGRNRVHMAGADSELLRRAA
jgi:diguanylate cyclase (GGDEF)-like protein